MKFIFFIAIGFVLCTTFMAVPQTYGQTGSTFFFEDFDSVTPPALPANWIDTANEWSTSSSVASTGSGLNNLTVAGSQEASVQTPVVNLAGMTSGTIEYLARRTSTYPQDSLVVLASIDGGLTFSITLFNQGEALPVGDGSYEAISMAVPSEMLGQSEVVLLFTALGGTTSGANIRIDDVQIVGEGDPMTGNSTIGFSTETSILDETTGIVEVPVLLDFVNEEALQGIQATVTWDVSELNLDDIIPSSSISDPIDWQLTFDAKATELRLVILGNQASALLAGTYDPLFTLQFSLGTTSASTEAILTFESALGALALRTGDDAGLLLGTSSHTITLDAGDPTFEPDLTELSAGSVAIDAVSDAVLTVSNTGATDLVVSDVIVANPLFTVTPTDATVVPGAAQQFVISFAPTFTDFGFQSSTLIFLHNAVGGSDTLSVSGTGTGGRGDASKDGIVDVLDLVLGIDYVIEVDTPDTMQTTSTDMFPFGIPDGSLDVRDLTVISQAILLGVWPDDLPLPEAAAASEVNFGKNASDSAYVQLKPSFEEEGGTLNMQNHVPVRAIQIAMSLDSALLNPAPAVNSHPDLTIQFHHDVWNNELRVIALRMDGGSIPPGTYPLIGLQNYGPEHSLSLQYALAIGVDRQRLPIIWTSAEDTAVEENPIDTPDVNVGAPYPNPYERRIDQSLFIPVTVAGEKPLHAEIYDLLGRQVITLRNRSTTRGQQLLTWKGSDQHGRLVAPGLYLIRVSIEGKEQIRTIVVR